MFRRRRGSRARSAAVVVCGTGRLPFAEQSWRRGEKNDRNIYIKKTLSCGGWRLGRSSRAAGAKERKKRRRTGDRRCARVFRGERDPRRMRWRRVADRKRRRRERELSAGEEEEKNRSTAAVSRPAVRRRCRSLPEGEEKECRGWCAGCRWKRKAAFACMGCQRGEGGGCKEALTKGGPHAASKAVVGGDFTSNVGHCGGVVAVSFTNSMWGSCVKDAKGSKWAARCVGQRVSTKTHII